MKIIALLACALFAIGSGTAHANWVIDGPDDYTTGSYTSQALSGTASVNSKVTATDTVKAEANTTASSAGGGSIGSASVSVVSSFTRNWKWQSTNPVPATASTTASYKYQGDLYAAVTGNGLIPPSATASVEWRLPFGTNLSNSITAFPTQTPLALPISSTPGNSNHGVAITTNGLGSFITDTAVLEMRNNNAYARAVPLGSTAIAISGNNFQEWTGYVAN